MAIATAYLPVKLSGDGVTVAFSFGFRIYANTDLKVSWILKTTGEVSEVKILSTDYTVAINANSEGGIVTFGSGDIPPSTVWVLIESIIPKTQSTILGLDAKLSEQSIERMADRQCRLTQQAAEAIDRSLKIPPSLASAGIDMNIPVPVASKVIGFNAAGDGFELYEADSGVAAAAAEAAAVDAAAAQVSAETAQGLAETAQTAAETAQGLAEDAQAAAEALIVPATQTQMEAATDNANVVTPLAVKWNPGVAKAWANFDSIPGTPTIAASHNVTSLIDNGIGDITVNWTIAFSSANYVVVGVADDATAGHLKMKTYATGSIRIHQAQTTTGGDVDGKFYIVAFGDQ